PMKCFCDIPLGMIQKHIHTYGRFGIGITKDYAMRNYITPVFYFHENSDTVYRYISNSNPGEEMQYYSLIPYFKIIEKVVQTGDNITTENYYNEREWRFIGGSPVDL